MCRASSSSNGRAIAVVDVPLDGGEATAAILLREGYRENGKVVKRTLANLSHWDPQLVEHFRVLLKGGVAVESASSVLSIEPWENPPIIILDAGKS